MSRRAALLLLGGLIGCSDRPPVVIDGSSAEAFAATSEQARRDLPVSDRLAFDAAMKRVPGNRTTTDPVAMEALARTTYNGMTAKEVVDLTR